MKGRYLIRLLLPLLLFGLSCTQQPEKKGLPERVAREKPAPAKEKPLKIIHVAGETTSVNPRAGILTVRGKDGEVSIYVTEKTVIHVGADKGRLADVNVGNKATVKYLVIGGKNIARSIFIAQEAREEKEPPKAEIPLPQPPEKSTPEQPPAAPSPKAWPPS